MYNLTKTNTHFHHDHIEIRCPNMKETYLGTFKAFTGSGSCCSSLTICFCLLFGNWDLSGVLPGILTATGRHRVILWSSPPPPSSSSALLSPSSHSSTSSVWALAQSLLQDLLLSLHLGDLQQEVVEWSLHNLGQLAHSKVQDLLHDWLQLVCRGETERKIIIIIKCQCLCQ